MTSNNPNVKMPTEPPILDPADYQAWKDRQQQIEQFQASTILRADAKNAAELARNRHVDNLVFALENAAACSSIEEIQELLALTMFYESGELNEASIPDTSGAKLHNNPSHPFNLLRREKPQVQLCGLIVLDAALTQTNFTTEQERRIIKTHDEVIKEIGAPSRNYSRRLIRRASVVLNENDRLFGKAAIVTWLTSKNRGQRIPESHRLARKLNLSRLRAVDAFDYRHFSRAARREKP